MTVPITEQIKCVERELKLRERVYPRRIAAGKMSRELANREWEHMTAVLETLRGIDESTRLL